MFNRVGVAALFIFGKQWKPDGECCTLTFTRTIDLHGTAMKFDEVPHDRKPQPQTTKLSRAGAVGLAKAFEHMR
jgi:hypothetical protein